jgi:hypothetical protein
VIVNSGAQTIEFADGSAGAPSITNSGDTNTGMFFPAADTIAFAEGGAEAMRLDSAGNVGIGVTPSAWESGASVLQFNTSGPSGTANDKAAIWCRNDSIRVISGVYFDGGNYIYNATGVYPSSLSVSSSDGGLAFATGATGTIGNTTSISTKFSINSSGNLTITGATATKASGTTWANPSDIRLKDNVQDFNKGLTELLQVNVKTWEYNGKGGTVEGTKGIGVIADEIEIVLPETVDTYKAKLNEDDAENADIKRFDATEITWLLVKSIQEQQTIINDIKTELDNVKTELATLKGAPQ